MSGLSVFTFLLLVAVVLPIVVAVKQRLTHLANTVTELRKQVDLQTQQIHSLEDRLTEAEKEALSERLQQALERTEKQPDVALLPIVDEAPPEAEPPEARMPRPARASIERAMPARELADAGTSAGPHEGKPREPAAPHEPTRLEQIQQKFVENWTGILGALVVVAGVTFIGIYTALRLAPLYRFALTLAGGGALIGIATALVRHKDWQDLAAWIRSAGAAIVLFACAAAGGLPGLGLQWIEAPVPALALLLAGIAVNLYLAWVGKREIFASLHVLLSLLPLAIVPPSVTGLALASVVALYGVGLAIHCRWDRHLLVVLSAYFLFQILWFTRMGLALDQNEVRMVAWGCGAAVFGAGLLSHHLRGYARSDNAVLQVWAQIFSTGMLALLSFAYLTDVEPRSAVLVVLAVVEWLQARHAKRKNIAWLYRADILGGQAFVLLALVGALQLGVSHLLVAVVALAEVIAFRRLVARGSDALLDRVVDALPAVAAVVVILVGLDAIMTQTLAVAQASGLMVVAVALCVAGQRVLQVPVEAPGDSPWVLSSPGEALGWVAGGVTGLAAYGAMG